jgi:anthranilate phosphoribosyltransferase
MAYLPGGGSGYGATVTDRSAFEDFGGWPGLLSLVSTGQDLTQPQAEAAMGQILSGEATSAQIAGLIVALRLKGETVEELTGLAKGMLAAAEPLRLPANAVDIVGTGGSAHRRQHALNVSTMAAFVAASAGATVCKHGNFKASSTSGAFDFLETLGIQVHLSGPQLEACVAETGIGFALARDFHPSMRHAGPVRAELGIQTVFNILGPIAHPGQPKRQLVGTSDESMAGLMAEVFQAMGSERAWVVTGAGGLDELSTTGPSVIFDVTPNNIERLEIDLRFLGITPPESMDALSGGDAAANVAIFNRILSGEERGSRYDIVLLNAGATLVVGGLTDDLASGIRAAAEAIDEGRTRVLVDRAISFTNA